MKSDWIIGKIRFDPGQSSRSETKLGSETLKMNSVINGIKSSSQIKETATGDLLMTHGLDVIMNGM
jgi:hypothetical protein